MLKKIRSLIKISASVLRSIPKIYIAVLLIILLLHIPYINNGFIWFDHNDIEQGFALVPLKEIYKAFIIPFGQTSFYRPVVTIVNSFDFALYGNRAVGYHITNLIIQFLVVIASFKFITAFWNIDKKILPLVILFLGTHPLTIFINASINHRQESLLLLFTLLCLYFYKKYRESNDIKFKIFSAISLTLAIFSKETALVVLPLLIVLTDLLGSSASGIPGLKNIRKVISQNAKMYIVFAIPTLIYLALRYFAVPRTWGLKQPELDLSSHISLRIYLLGKMLLELISPFKPNLSDAVPVLKLSSPNVIVPVLIVGGLAFYVIRRGINKSLLLALLMTLVLLLPGLDLVPVPRIGSPHYSYLAIPPFCAFVFSFAQAQKNLLKKLTLSIIILWIITSAYSTYISGRLFKDDAALFSYETLKDPNFVEGYYYLGNSYIKQGQFQKALDSYNKTNEVRNNLLYFKDQLSIEFNRATALMQLGKTDQALKIYKQLEKASNESYKPFILFNEALIYYQNKDFAKAIEVLESRDWQIPDAYLLLAECYGKTGNSEKQQETINKVLKLEEK